VIGDRAFIGSTCLIAPVRIGADAIAAGSAVSRDVSDGERLVRAEQLVKPGWADRFHDAMKKKRPRARSRGGAGGG
jgi:bifunctional UDP-N-acetylglucosamine pyrophosphorylase/glucosamine-1-phosphate N-acetyltransferase